MPILSKNKRLRDFNYIKLFLIAIVWSFTTAFIPSILLKLPGLVMVLITLERFFFFIAITIPFDIRDLAIDKEINVKTLAHILSKKGNLVLVISCLLICIILYIVFFIQGVIALNYLLGLVLCYSFIGLLIWRSESIKSDYYYTGVLDGTMILVYITIFMISMVS